MKESINLNEIIATDEFIAILSSNISDLHRQRRLRPQPKAGYYYKRDWYDLMSEQSVLDADYFLKHIVDIWMKKSNLSSVFRNVILAVCNKSLREYLIKESEKVKEESK